MAVVRRADCACGLTDATNCAGQPECRTPRDVETEEIIRLLTLERDQAYIDASRLREDRENLADFIENIADQGFEVLRGEDGSWRVVT